MSKYISSRLAAEGQWDKVKYIDNTWLGIKPEFSDYEIREWCSEMMGWDDVVLVREPALVKVQPVSDD